MKKILQTSILLIFLGSLNNSSIAYDYYSGGMGYFCFHGTSSNPYEEVLGIVFGNQQCPAPSHTYNKQHNADDPDCRVTREINST